MNPKMFIFPLELSNLILKIQNWNPHQIDKLNYCSLEHYKSHFSSTVCIALRQKRLLVCCDPRGWCWCWRWRRRLSLFHTLCTKKSSQTRGTKPSHARPGQVDFTTCNWLHFFWNTLKNILWFEFISCKY